MIGSSTSSKNEGGNAVQSLPWAQERNSLEHLPARGGRSAGRRHLGAAPGAAEPGSGRGWHRDRDQERGRDQDQERDRPAGAGGVRPEPLPGEPSVREAAERGPGCPGYPGCLSRRCGGTTEQEQQEDQDQEEHQDQDQDQVSGRGLGGSGCFRGAPPGSEAAAAPVASLRSLAPAPSRREQGF